MLQKGPLGDWSTALGFRLFLMCEGNRLLKTGEWLVPFLISKKKKNLSLSRLGSSGKKPWTLVVRDEDPLTSQKHRGLEGVREGSGDGVFRFSSSLYL